MMPGGKQDPALPPAPRAARLTVTAKPVLQNNATGAGDSRNQALSNFDDQEGKRKAYRCWGGGGTTHDDTEEGVRGNLPQIGNTSTSFQT